MALTEPGKKTYKSEERKWLILQDLNRLPYSILIQLSANFSNLTPTMFSKVAILMTATMAALVVAGDINDSCNSGPVQCCMCPYLLFFVSDFDNLKSRQPDVRVWL